MNDDQATAAKPRTALTGLERALRTRTCPRCGRMSTMHVGRGRRRCLPCQLEYDPKPEDRP